MQVLNGSICLSDIPKELIKRIECKDGKTRLFLNIRVVERKEPITFGSGDGARTFTHFIAAGCRQEEQVEGKKYIWGDLKPYEQAASYAPPTDEELKNALSMTDDDENDLPF